MILFILEFLVVAMLSGTLICGVLNLDPVADRIPRHVNFPLRRDRLCGERVINQAVSILKDAWPINRRAALATANKNYCNRTHAARSMANQAEIAAEICVLR